MSHCAWRRWHRASCQMPERRGALFRPAPKNKMTAAVAAFTRPDAQRKGDRHVAARGRTVQDFQRRRAAPCRNVSVSTVMLCAGFEGAAVEQISPELSGRHLLPRGARLERAPRGSYEPPCSSRLFMAAPVNIVSRGNVAHLVCTSNRGHRQCSPTRPIDTVSRRACSGSAERSKPRGAKMPARDAAHP